MRYWVAAVIVMAVAFTFGIPEPLPSSQRAEPDTLQSDLRRHREPRTATPQATPAPTPTPTAVVTEPPALATPEPVASSWTSPPPAPTNVYPPEMVDAMCNQGFAWDCSVALEICWLEMGRRYQPWAINQTPIYIEGIENHAHGLCQLLMPLHAGWFNYPGGDPLDIYQNAAATYGLWQASGGTFCKHWFFWCSPY